MAPTEACVEMIREKFQREHGENPDLYHQVDVQRVQQEEWQVRRFLEEYPNMDEAYSKMLESLRWKKKVGVHDRDDQYFPKEFWEKSEADIAGQTFQNHWIQWEVIRNQVPTKQLRPIALQFVTHMMERVDRVSGPDKFVLVIDTNGMSASNVDMEIIRHKLSIIEYYPGSVKQIYILDLTWFTTALISGVLRLVNPKIRQLIVYMKSKELKKYMNPGQIPRSLGGTKDKLNLPENLLSFRDPDHLERFNFSEKDLEQIAASLQIDI